MIILCLPLDPEVRAKNELAQKAFLFACYTGLRFKDVKRITKNDIVKIENNIFELMIVMSKTSEVLSIPLHPKAMDIIDSIETSSSLQQIFSDLKYSNQMNIDLMYIAFQAGIQKRIFFYTSRHSFASNLLNEGVDFLTIKEFLGHKNLKTTTIYTKMSSKRKYKHILMLK